MIFVFFIYGLAFFTLGLSIVLYPKKESAFTLAGNLWLIAAFGLVHGANEWFEMFLLIRPLTESMLVNIVGLVLLAGSFSFLIQFGIRVIINEKRGLAALRALPLLLLLVWSGVVLLSHDRVVTAAVMTRYLFGLPGTILTAYAFLLQVQGLAHVREQAVKQYLYVAAGAFFCYGILAGLVVPDAGFFPASVLNTSFFSQGIGVPVQIFRALCAVAIAYSMIRVLDVFHWEARTALQQSRDALQKAYDEVEQKVRERTAELMIAGSRLQQEMIDHRRSAAELRLFQDLISESNDALFVIEADTGRLLYVNVQACTNLQYTCAELLNMHVHDYAVNAPDSTSWKQFSQKIKDRGYIYFETEQRRKDGTLLPVEVSARYTVHDGKQYIISIARDITERRLAITALQKWVDIFRYTKIGVVIFGAEAKTLDLMNDAFAAMHGYDRKTIMGRAIDDIIAPAERAAVRGQMESVPFKKHVVFDTVNVRKDGTTFPAQIDVVSVESESGTVSYYIMNIMDISDRKQVEEVLRFSSHQWRTTFDAIRDMIFILDKGGKIKRCNRAAVGYLGHPMEEIVGRDICEIIPGFRTAVKECPYERMLVTRTREHAIMQHEDRWFDVIADPMLDNTGAVMGAVQILYDITDSKRMEAELIKSQKLESIGVLAGGIAHDFNNILTGIMGNISLALLDEDIKNNVAARLTEAEKSCVRAKYLTQQLITFASGGAPIKRITPVASLVREAVSLALSGSAVKPEFAVLDDWCMAKIDEGQIRQVIHNIVANSVDAMPAGGTVTVSCVCVAPGSDERMPATMGPAVKISVRDEGAGISKADMPRIFDPFFTLKQKRSGLGLATSYSIVRNHGGVITAESQPGLGTVLHLYLPAVEAELSGPRVAAQTGSAARILVMDDEKMVRDVAGHMLRHMGHEVSFAEDGIDAVRLYWEAKDQDRPFDIVVLDMTIPGGPGGKETIEKLRAIDADVKAIVSSGYSNDPVLSKFREYGFSAVVVKPYKFDELREAVQALLPAFR